MNEWSKCNFCSKPSWDACNWCSLYDAYRPNPDALIQVAKEKGISVSDVIKLIEYCGKDRL